MAISLKEKKYTETPLWMSILLYVSIVSIFLVIVAFFLFNYLGLKAESELKTIEPKLSQGVELEKELKVNQQRIGDFAKIISERKDTISFLNFFEKICHPLVWVQELKVDLAKNEVSFSGKTESFISLGQQYLFLKSHPAIEGVDLSNIEIDSKEGGVLFSFVVRFNDQVFKEAEKHTEQVSENE